MPPKSPEPPGVAAGDAALAAQMKSRFRVLDDDQSGTISETDLRAVFLSLDLPWTEKQLSALLQSAGRDDSGRVAYEEFIDFLLFADKTDTLVEFAWLTNAPNTEATDNGHCLLMMGDRIITCLAGFLFPPIGRYTWSLILEGCPSNSRAWLEVGITLEGGDVSDDSLSAKIAPPGSRMAMACGICNDGELIATLDMDEGSFSFSGCGSGPTCNLTCKETQPQSVHTGIGDIRGKLWRPFFKCSKADGLVVRLANFEFSGQVTSSVVQSASSAGRSDPEALGLLKDLLPGSGGQPGPGINDIQCVLPAEPDKGRGALYISGSSPVTERNLEKINTVVILRFGTKHKPLPSHLFVKEVDLVDAKTADFGSHIASCNGFLEEHLGEHRNVLVHCAAGASRSGSSIVAYLMLSRHLRYKEALGYAQRAREWICPNDSFALQLEQYESQLAAAGHFGESDAPESMSGLGPAFADVQCVRSPGKLGGLYISGAKGASFRNLTLLDVQALVRLGGFTYAPEKPDVEHLTLALDDSQDADLTDVLESAVPFVQARRLNGKNILVHCGAGISRSAAVVTAVLMREEQLLAEEAMGAVKAARQWASPNPGFQRQLRNWT